MRWLTFLLLAGLALVLQSAIAPFVEIFGVRPDWLLVVVVFFSLYARASDAALGAWMIGFAADLMTIERMGLLSLSYLAAALLVSTIRDYVFCYRAGTQFIVTAVICFIVHFGWWTYRHVLYDPAGSLFVDFVQHVALSSLYTAVWAPFVHRFLLMGGRWFGIPRPRYTHTGMNSLVKRSV
ncbi:MAG: rod shape-determining protein MreD [Planctomycetes bacterium]|nr:rod shape-determining protein MreD [Planctomycetota bacterium]